MGQRREADVANTDLLGTRGLGVLQQRGRFVAEDPAVFRWRWRRVGIDGVEVVEWSTTPLAGASSVGSSVHPVVLLVMLEGVLRYRLDSIAGTAVGGDVLVLAAAERIRFDAPRRMRCLRIAVSEAVLPPRLRLATATSVGAVSRTRLVESLTSIVEVVLDPAAGGSGCPAARALRSLAVAALEDLVPPAVDLDQRARLVAFVEAHLHDPDLSPQSIADALGLSLRWVHHLFSRDGDTLARYIRERRLELVAAHLRSDRRSPRIGALAARSGFTSRDQMTRAFRARYGVSVSDYARRAAVEGLPPGQPSSRSLERSS